MADMTLKRVFTLGIFVFLGIFTVLKVISLHKTYSPVTARLSGNAYIYAEPTEKPFLGLISYSILSGILSGLGQFSIFGIGSGGDSYLENACLNGQDPSNMGVQEQLLEFIQGPCLPVVLIPGLLASKLQVNIDCETLQSENPEIFSSCGWSSCSGWAILRNTPAPNYTLWVSDFFSPMSLVLESTSECWGNLIQLEYDPSQPNITQKYTSPAGVQIVIDTATTNTQEECGLSSEDNLLISPLQVSYTVGYEAMKNSLIAMGYQVGLTLYGAPYDWRKTTLANGIASNLNATVRQIYNLTGKPTVLVAHSLGNFGTLYLLNNMSQEDKNTYIANYVSLMNPLSGSPSSVGDYLGGDTDYIFHSFGVGFVAQKRLMQANSGNFDVLVKDPFTYFADAQWMVDWKSRNYLEDVFNGSTPDGQLAWQDLVESGNYTYKWFPTPAQQCFQGFQDRPDQCGMYMYDWSTEALVTIEHQMFTGSTEDVAQIFEDYVITTENYAGMVEDCKTNNVYLIENPGVPTTIIYASHLLTKKAYEYDYDPTTLTTNNGFAVANVTTYSQGDETVPTTSSLMAALKWSWEFDNGVENAKPVKTVEVCSIYNTRNTIYDVEDSDAPYQVLYNEYQGVGCECIPQNGTTTSGADCNHSDIISDTGIIQFIQNIVNANYKNADYEQTGAYLLNDTQLTQLAANCPTVVLGTTLYEDLIDQVSIDTLSV